LNYLFSLFTIQREQLLIQLLFLLLLLPEELAVESCQQLPLLLRLDAKLLPRREAESVEELLEQTSIGIFLQR